MIQTNKTTGANKMTNKALIEPTLFIENFKMESISTMNIEEIKKLVQDLDGFDWLNEFGREYVIYKLGMRLVEIV